MKGEQGFVLLDVISGVLILCLGITFLMDLSQGARGAVVSSHWKEQALNQAQAELEEIKALGLGGAVAGGRVVPDGTIDKVVTDHIKLKITSKLLQPELVEIDVESGWSAGSVHGRVGLSTLLSGR